MDWITLFLEKTSRVPSPEIFRLWTAITTISGMLERRVWTQAAGPIYPNVFTLLVGPPASGKTQAINRGRDIWKRIKELNISPDNMTKASFVVTLMNAMRTVFKENGTGMMMYNALCLQSPEFGVLFPNHYLEFISIMNHIYDSPPFYEEERIVAGARKVNKPHMTIIAGTQPDFLSVFLPEKAWGMGFCSRLIMIYGEKPPTSSEDFFADEKDAKDDDDDANTAVKDLANQLRSHMQTVGKFEWTSEAKDRFNSWRQSGMNPVPAHARLEHYLGRRHINIVKLAMISAISSTGKLRIELYDIERAFSWLFSAEQTMPEIFNAMSQKSDEALLQDLALMVERRWDETKRSVSKQQLYLFLRKKMQVERIERIINAAEASGMIVLEDALFKDKYIPPKVAEEKQQKKNKGSSS